MARRNCRQYQSNKRVFAQEDQVLAHSRVPPDWLVRRRVGMAEVAGSSPAHGQKGFGVVLLKGEYQNLVWLGISVGTSERLKIVRSPV